MDTKTFNKIVDEAINGVCTQKRTVDNGQHTINAVLFGKISNLESEIRSLSAGTAWNEVAQRLVNIEQWLQQQKQKEFKKDTVWVIQINDKSKNKLSIKIEELEVAKFSPSKEKPYHLITQDDNGIKIGKDFKFAFRTKQAAIDVLKKMVEEAVV